MKIQNIKYSSSLSGISDLMPVKNNDSIMPPKLLIVDDSPSSIAPVNLVFLELGCLVDVAFEGHEASNLFLKNEYDLIVLDWGLPDVTGGELIDRMERLVSHGSKDYDLLLKTPIILYTAADLEALPLRGGDSFEVISYWHKPMSFSEISRSANRALSMMYSMEWGG